MERKTAIASVLVFLGLAATAAVWTNSGTDIDTNAQFQSFVQRFGKEYASEEERNLRMSLYAEAAELVRTHNAESTSFQLELNEFADLLPSELPLGFIEVGDVSAGDEEWIETSDLPEEVDWRSLGAVTKAKNQKDCGSCWAFSAIGALEGAHFLSTGELLSLSEQQLVDCAQHFGNHGCKGGKMDKAFKYVMSVGGVEPEAEYKYKAEKGKCKAEDAKFVGKIQGYKNVPKFNERQLKAAVAQRPVSVAVQASQPHFHLYKSGVIDAHCGHDLDHGVLLVGYGEENGMPYWIVKNSWGRHWGDHGFVKVLRDDSNTSSAGMCGIASYASYPF